MSEIGSGKVVDGPRMKLVVAVAGEFFRPNCGQRRSVRRVARLDHVLARYDQALHRPTSTPAL